MHTRLGMLAAGSFIFGRKLEILELAGEGGMGQVFRARDRRTGVMVAVKTLGPEHAALPRVRAALDLEAAALAACRVRGVPRLVAQGRIGQRAPCIVMEWCEGRRLSDLLREDLPLARVAEITLELLRIVGELHAQGWVHGDINPNNVLVADDRRGRLMVTLIDLGLARRPLRTDESRVAHEVCGTPAFMAPELLWGVPTSAASDLYAVGGLFHALLTGRAPFAGGSPMSVALRVLADDEAESTRAVMPGPLGDFVRQALHRDPARRFASAQAMQAGVLGALRGRRAPARRRVDPYARTVLLAQAA